MTDHKKLKCTRCGEVLDLRVAYDGYDVDSTAGNGSGFKYEIVLDCDNCGYVYPIGRVKSEVDFCENVEKLRPYGKEKRGGRR
jgi:uncharacterized Zn finger protein